MNRFRFSIGMIGRALIGAAFFAAQMGSVSTAAAGQIRFEAGHQQYQAKGAFEDWEIAHCALPDDDLEKLELDLRIDLQSVTETSADLAAHLRTEDFFHVARHPEATVLISGLERVGRVRYVGKAEVSLHGETHTVGISVEESAFEPRTIVGHCVVRRSDFGIGRPYNPGDPRSIRDEVFITVETVLEPSGSEGGRT